MAEEEALPKRPKHPNTFIGIDDETTIREMTQYINRLELYLGELVVELEKLEPTCELTDKEVNEFLAHEDDRGEIFQTGIEQGRLEVIKKVLDCLR